MPTYQYRCADCSDELEVVQKFTDDPLSTCPECAGTLRKVFSPVGVVFKGSGFYATDNRTKGKAAASKPGAEPAKPTSEPAASATPSATAPADSKPAPAAAGASAA